MPKPIFRFKQFVVHQDRCAMKVSTDGVLFGAWLNSTGARRVLDIGTGTGLLALIVAQRNQQAFIDAVEMDDQAAQQAAENVAQSPWSDRIRVHRMDIRRLNATERYDLVICNPPYYQGYSDPSDERTALAKHGAELRFDDLLDSVERLLMPNGVFTVIVPIERQDELLNEAGRIGLSLKRRCQVRYVPGRAPKRVLMELSPQAAAPLEEELTVEATGPYDYTSEYRALIRDLMLNF